jgi:hypothetical protein
LQENLGSASTGGKLHCHIVVVLEYIFICLLTIYVKGGFGMHKKALIILGGAVVIAILVLSHLAKKKHHYHGELVKK